MHPPRECAIVVPNVPAIEPDCERSLGALERRGYVIIKGQGTSPIDMVRSQLATDLVLEGFKETLWINGDISFSADDVDKIRRHDLPITAALHPRPGILAMAAKLLPGTQSISFGMAGGLTEIQYASAGFLHVRRDVYDTMQTKLGLPVCNAVTGRPIVPYFLPMVAPMDGSPFYLADDYSFCERARQVGFRIMADTTIRLWHIGTTRTSWEDAAEARIRHDAFIFAVSEYSQG